MLKPIEKYIKNLNRQVTDEEMTNTYIRRNSTSLIILEMPIQIKIRYHFIVTTLWQEDHTLAKVKKCVNTKYSKDVKQSQMPYNTFVSKDWHRPLWKQLGTIW